MKLRLAMVVSSLCIAAGTAFADDPVLQDLRVVRDGGGYLAFARLEGALSPKLLEEIAAGLETTIGYRLNVYRRRPGLPDQAIAKERIEHIVQRDALTREYSLTRRLNDEVQETRVATDESEMREFMTILDGFPLIDASALSAEGEFYLKAKAEIGFIWRFYLIPWPLDTDWVRVPIDIAGESESAEQPQP